MSENDDPLLPRREGSLPLVNAQSRSGLAEYAAGPATQLVAANSTPAGGFNPNEILRIIYKWRTLILISLIAGPLIGFLISLLITPIYSARSTIEINNEPPKVVTMGEDVQPMVVASDEFLATQIGLLRSKSLALQVVDALGLANNADFIEQTGTVQGRRNAAAAELLRNLKIEPQRGSRLVTITINDPNPTLASRIAGSYADEFIGANLRRRYDASSYARNFLQRQLATTRGRLEASERSLVQYAEKKGILDLNADEKSGGQSSLDASSLVAVNQALVQARTERIAAEARYRQAGSGSTMEVIQNPTVQALTAQRAQLQAEYQDKLSTFLPGLPAMVALKARIDALERQISQASSNVGGALRSEYNAAVQRESALQARLNQLRSSVLDLRDRSIDYTILQREVDTNRALYDALLQRFKEVGVSSGVGTNLVSIVDRPEVPTRPVSPNIPVNVALGLLVGAIVGFGVAFLIEFIDDTIKSPEDVANKLGLTVLGVVPVNASDESIDTVVADPKSEMTEAFYSIMTALQFTTGHGVPKTLLVSSSRAGEGKSSAVLALATSFARLGKRVLLIDADLRKPAFTVPDDVREGLTNLLSGGEDVRACIRKTVVPNLYLIPAGPRVPNPAELLATSRFRQLLDELSPVFDLVLVDGPPVLGLADAPLLGSVCEGAVIVIETANIRRLVAQNAVARLRSSNTRILGAILNKFNPKRSGYGYGYGYGYGAYSYGNDNSTDEQKAARQIKLLR